MPQTYLTPAVAPITFSAGFPLKNGRTANVKPLSTSGWWER